MTQYNENTALDEVYVLSLPAFAWFKADYPAQHPRILHTCHTVGNGQVLSVGGHDPTDVYNNSVTADPFMQGLGIFDLTKMRWSDRYDADAQLYQTPAVIKAWYAENGTSPIQWNNPDVQRLFQQANTTSGASTSTTPSQTSSASPSEKPPKIGNIGAIAGGVVGGVIVITLLLVWWLRRRRKRANRSGKSKDILPEQQAHESELSAKEKMQLHEMQDEFRPYEMDGSHSKAEMAGAYSAAELYGTQAHAELDGPRHYQPEGTKHLSMYDGETNSRDVYPSAGRNWAWTNLDLSEGQIFITI